MVGGHLDSWIAGTGATDNGAGSVMAMEAMRILKALDVHPRRTIRIALWSGEEQGLYGSQGYVKQHFGTFAAPNPPDPEGTPLFLAHHGALTTTKEWETLDAYYNLDNGTGKVRGVYCQGNYAVGPIFGQWIAPLADLGVSTITYRNTGGTDHLSYDAVGLPGFQFIQDPMDYETRTHHSDMDTVDRLHALDLEQGAAVEAIFLYNTAQREAMMPRKPLPHPERDRERAAPLPNLYPNAQVPGPDAGNPECWRWGLDGFDTERDEGFDLVLAEFDVEGAGAAVGQGCDLGLEFGFGGCGAVARAAEEFEGGGQVLFGEEDGGALGEHDLPLVLGLGLMMGDGDGLDHEEMGCVWLAGCWRGGCGVAEPAENSAII